MFWTNKTTRGLLYVNFYIFFARWKGKRRLFERRTRIKNRENQDKNTADTTYIIDRFTNSKIPY